MRHFRQGAIAAIIFSVPAVLPAALGGPPQSDRSSTTPAHVYACVDQIRADIDLIRFEMGRPRSKRPDLMVSSVAPREVYFLALSLFKKANRLGFQQTRTHADPPPTPTGEPQPADVLDVVQAALGRVRAVKEDIGITASTAALPVDPSKQPTDVFKSITQVNRQLNLLLDRRFSPSDVYQEVTLAIGYAARLLSCFPGDRIPDTPAREHGKRPQDVYRLLIRCLRIVEAIAQNSGLRIARLETTEEDVEGASPSDVYDIAALLVAELAYLFRQAGDLETPRPTYYPGRKFPSHVYQRVRLLELQLKELEAQVAAKPDWLDRGSGKE